MDNLRGRGKGSAAFAALAVFLTLAVVGCGVPLSAEEMANRPLPTPEDQVQVQSRSIGLTQESAPTPIPTPTPSSADSTLPTPASAALAPAATGTPAPASTPATTVAAASGSQTGSPTPTQAPFTSAELASQAVKIINDYRRSLNLAPLAEDQALATAAAAYAKLMADNNWWSCGCDVHRGPDGSTPASRVAASGYAGRFAGEALAGGQGSAQDAVNTWLNSPPHRAILLSATATDVGVGFYYRAGWPGFHWVLLTGTR